MKQTARPLCLVINLDRSPERWEHMRQHAQSRGLAVRRISAVDGNKIDDVMCDALFRIGDRKRALSKNEVACFESHKTAWEELVATELDYALILEDDVFLSNDIVRIIEGAAAVVPGFDLIKLNNYLKPVYIHTQPVAEVFGRKLLRPAEKTIDGSSYLISKSFAKTALLRFSSFSEELDLALFDPFVGSLVLQLCPGASVQQKFASFSFLPSERAESTLEASREEVRARAKSGTGNRSVGRKITAELRRFYYRRIWPNVVALTNPFRSTEDRFRKIKVEFVNSEFTGPPGTVQPPLEDHGARNGNP